MSAKTKVAAGVRFVIADVNVTVVKASVSKNNVCANVPLICINFLKLYINFFFLKRSSQIIPLTSFILDE